MVLGDGGADGGDDHDDDNDDDDNNNYNNMWCVGFKLGLSQGELDKHVDTRAP
jgi:hypothetical protein